MVIQRSDGIRLEDMDVARGYAQRPPYPPELHDMLVDLAPATGRALDLGCGPGKSAHSLASRFDHVEAVDPSAALLTVARETPSDIHWIEATAETAPLSAPTTS